MAKPALGRGLGALLGGGSSTAAKPAAPVVPENKQVNAPAESGERVHRVSVTRVQPCPFQPRKDFTPETLQELADSIREKGIIQPLIVRAQGSQFELIAGERRWRAAQLAGLTEVPVVVRDADDRTVLEVALIENLQRENLNPVEEALGYSELMKKFELTQDEVASKVGKSRPVVANALRILRLPAEVQSEIRHGQLSVGHAKVLAGLSDTVVIGRLVRQIIDKGLSVRQTETLAQASTSQTPSESSSPKSEKPRDLHTADLENRLQEKLGTKVSLRYREGKGAIEIKFFNDDDLERVLQIIGVSQD